MYFPVKALPTPEFLRKLAPYVDGFDVSNLTELRALEGLGSALSVSSPSGAELVRLGPKLRARRALVSLQSTSPLELVTGKGDFLLRLNPYDFVGATSSIHPSRFGLGRRDFLSVPLPTYQRKNFYGFSTHFGLGATTSEFVVHYLSHLRRDCRRLNFSPRILNLGGGWLSFQEKDFRLVREAALKLFPAAEVWLESGAGVTQHGISAIATVLEVTRTQRDVFLHLNLSFEANLKWSKPNVLLPGSLGPLVPSPVNHKSPGPRLWLCGNTCSESDRIGPFHFERAISFQDLGGKKITLTGLLGYSIAWDIDFNGVPKLGVRILD